jgi:3-methyladenine DNA glycosylase/8-oxoguanine DNA glycosylase
VAEELELELVGAGGEPVDLWRTLVSHGVAALPPADIDEEARTLETTLDAGGPKARTLVLAQGRDGYGRLELRGRRAGARERAAIVATVRHMLRLDEDLSRFYELIRDDELAWCAHGAGRMLRAPTVFEDVAKTRCTTNTAWSGTAR